MPVRIYPVHKLKHRTRFRTEALDSNPELAATLGLILENTPGARDFAINPQTGSVLVNHPDVTIDELIEQINKSSDISIIPRRPPREPMIDRALEGVKQADKVIRDSSSGNIDLRTIGLALLMIIIVRQIYRGELMGAAIPLLISSLNIIGKTSRDSHNPDPGDAGH